ncbi:OmpA family protein [Rufibacter sp. LB8]|uniref:OmpA family protein n=1 Tax=Rufibacter sp. LB8 TaxID=2777781 RepID=UPI00178C2D40|nr:OmpA family protein [Rufibacter sp. LB8]
MMKHTALTLFCLFTLQTAFGQTNLEFDKKNFEANKDGFREAKKKLDAGDEIFAATSKKTDDAYRKTNYKNAIEPYKAAYAFNPNSALLNYRLGVSYLFAGDATNAATHLENARKLNPAVDPEVGFYLGRTYHLLLDWKKATTEYKKYLTTLPTEKNKEKIERVNKHVRECLSGQELQKKPLRVFVDPLGQDINSQYNEMFAVIAADESRMVFSSNRPANQETKAKLDKQLNLDLYISNKISGQWSVPQQMGEALNTEKDETALALSTDGQRLIFLREENEGDLFETVLKGDQWSKPEDLGKEINSNARESSATYSYDGKTLYFISNRPNGIGQQDIYFSVKDSKGNWGKAVNAGPNLNTPYNEGNLFLMPDGKTLYFTSEGHNSMGGHDIFKSVLENGQWSKPENLGFPLNSPDDDQFLAMEASGRFGYMAGFKLEAGKPQADLFRVTFLGPEKPVLLSSEDDLIASTALYTAQPTKQPTVETRGPQAVLLTGVVTDGKTQKPMEAKIDLVDNAKKEVIATFTSNAVTGKYVVSLPAGKNYGVVLHANDMLFSSHNVDLSAGTAFKKTEVNVKLQPVDGVNVLALHNVFFEANAASVKPESLSELDRVVELMKDKRSLKAEVVAYAATTEEEAKDQALAQSRAKTVLDYLVTKGINVKRLQAKGNGVKPSVNAPLVELQLTTK